MILFVALFAAAVVYLLLRTKLDEMEARLLERDRRLAALTERIFALEQRGVAAAPPQPPAPPPPAAAPVVMAAPPAAIPPAMRPPPPLPSAPPAPKLDLEALIGGNWLSKLGVLILLIGLALFISFALAEFGPAGRIAIGLATSLSLLGAGIGFERKEDFRTLGRALLGGGWAGLYFTAFAAHGVEAARVIESAGTGFVLLLGVSGAMILHSLRYQSQTVTGLAYMAAFLTIALSAATKFSAIAAIPLLASLLAVAWKYGWQRLAAAGASFAYLAYGFDLATGDKDRYFTTFGEPFLWIYWVMLEVYDLAALRKGATLPVAPFNVTGFLLATSAVWPQSGWSPGPMLGAMGVAQLISAVLRGRRNGQGEFEDSSLFGGYRASLTYSAAFATAQILHRFEALPESLAMALLAQLIAFFGWMLRSSYVRALGAGLFAIPLVLPALYVFFGHAPWWPAVYWTLGALAFVNRTFLSGGIWYSIGGTITLGAAAADFRPDSFRPILLTLCAGLAGLLLRWREKVEAKWVGVSLAFVSIVALTANTPKSLIWVTIALPALIYGAFGAVQIPGLPRLATFVAMQIYVSALLFAIADDSPWLIAVWAAQAAASWALRVDALAWSAYVPELLAVLFWMDKAGGRAEALWPKLVAAGLFLAMHLIRQNVVHAALAVFLVTLLIGEFVSGPRLTLAWGAEAAAVLALGFVLQQRPVRLGGLALFAMCLGKLFFYDFSQLEMLSRIASFIVLGLLLIGASWAYSKYKDQIQRYL
ncbi:MAG: DUF2339 domain-containing protein [Acidobacteria bacterium]|nr:DUF2339 domain-containing protein [Acidobacteriota bacterium]